MKKVPISKKVWREIHQIKRDKKLSTYSAVIEQLLNPKVGLKGETVPDIQVSDIDKQILTSKSTLKEETVMDIPTVDPEKFLKALLSQRTWDQISKLKKDRQFDSFSRVFDILLDAYNLIHMEKARDKVKEKQEMALIYEHIEELGTPGYSEELGLMTIPEVFSEKSWLCCPLCWSSFPLWSESPETKPGRGIVFEFIDGSNQRRFRGVDDKFQPIEMRQGDKLLVEKSMAIGTLRRLDPRLYAHILSKLESAYFKFGGRKL